MAMLDDLSGFEFEDLMEDVFRNLGYENVRQSVQTGDEGRDILMEESVDGRRRAVVVECKHKETVSRPVVQKLHSAVTTYEFDGPKRGIVVTTGRFTGPAEEYAQRVGDGGGSIQIDLIDGRQLRDIADDVGLDLYNGRIEVLCDEMLRPYDPVGGVRAPVDEEFEDVQNIDSTSVPDPAAHVDLMPVLEIRAETNAVFETSVGVIHRIDQRDRFVLRGDRDGTDVLDAAVRQLVEDNRNQAVDVNEDALATTFDAVETHHFGLTETEYKEWAVDRLRQAHTTTVEYTGDNNVDYQKTCEPNKSDISVQSIDPIYVPQVRQTTSLGDYSYPLEYYAAGPSRVTLENGIKRCVQCGAEDGGTYTYCENCGSINCPSHTETERLVGEPICTGCAVTERFTLSTKYFYDEENLEAFRDEYEAMPIHEKAMENPPLVGGATIALLASLFVLLSSAGVI